MRWNSSFNGALAATPVTLQSRDEDVYHPHNQSGRRMNALIKPTRNTQLNSRRTSVATTTTSESIRLSTTAVPSIDLSGTSNGVDDSFLVCSGRGVASDTPRSNNSHNDVAPTSEPLPVSLVNQNNEDAPLKSQRGHRRSDSELELIISELRERIVQQQLKQSAEEEESRSHQLSRRHLKNPVERMHMASSNSLPLRRQPSAGQVHASRLVSEGSAVIVTPVVMSSSSSRGALGSSTSHSVQYLQHPHQPHTTLDTEDAVNEADGLRIRSYDGATPSAQTLPQFVSSTSLGIGLPLQPQPIQPPLRSLEAPDAALVMRKPMKPRMRTLDDMDLELDRVDPEHDSSESMSPVGPWVVDHDAAFTSPQMTTSTSTASLSPTSSSTSLNATRQAPSASELSPRSRLLWLSDCGSDDEWGAPMSERVMAILRPGRSSGSPSRRPASAMDSERRHGRSLKTTKPARPRTASAKPAPPRKVGSSIGTNSQETSGRQKVLAQRNRPTIMRIPPRT